MIAQKALHFILATTLIFVNLVCSCASAFASIESVGSVPEGQNQHLEAPVNPDCPHQQCPDTHSALTCDCDQGALVSPSPSPTRVDLDNDQVQLHTTGEPSQTTWIPELPTGPPRSASFTLVPESPVRRHDLQLE